MYSQKRLRLYDRNVFIVYNRRDSKNKSGFRVLKVETSVEIY